jgi:hypothetical protein
MTATRARAAAPKARSISNTGRLRDAMIGVVAGFGSEGSIAEATYGLIAQLPFIVESYSVEPLAREFGPAFTRYTTLVRLHGVGEEGLGEDVTPFEAAQHAFGGSAAELPLGGEWTIDSFAALLDGVELYEGPQLPPGFPKTFRRWAMESAALDLALRQTGLGLADALGRKCEPVRFVNSLSLGERGIEVVTQRLARVPLLRFKLDPASDWSDELMEQLSCTGSVDIIDLKGLYPPQAPVALMPDPDLYRRIAVAFPDAWLEDPGLNPATREVLKPHLGRITWDLPVRTPEDIDRLPIPPRAINIKPARHGTLRRLLDVYDHCAERGIPTYGGGMGELAVGREQIQYLAALFHADAPNDVAPVAYNDYVLGPDLPSSPLGVQPAPAGFGIFASSS